MCQLGGRELGMFALIISSSRQSQNSRIMHRCWLVAACIQRVVLSVVSYLLSRFLVFFYYEEIAIPYFVVVVIE